MRDLEEILEKQKKQNRGIGWIDGFIVGLIVGVGITIFTFLLLS